MPTSPPLITVVTVVRNAVSTIEKTLESVLSQDYQNFEYVVIDGLSDDGTLDVINRYTDRITTFISEPDRGVYDAMNKAFLKSKGDALLFMNADDVFVNPQSLSMLAKVRYSHATDEPTICYADYQKYYPEMERSLLFSTSENFHRGMTICQQSMLADRAVFAKIGGFDLTYRLSSDLDWVVRAQRSGVTIVKAPIPPVALVLGGGLSDSQYQTSRAEGRAIVRRYYGLKGYVGILARQSLIGLLRWLARAMELFVGPKVIAHMRAAVMRVVRNQRVTGPTL